MRRCLTLLTLISAFITGCGGDKSTRIDDGDTTPPSRVTDLRVVAMTDSSATLAWTAPGDDGAVGTASQYVLRWSLSAITAESWDSCAVVPGLASPGAAGTGEMITVPGLTSATDYHYALKAADEVPNWSAMSNIALVAIADPAPLCWLSVQEIDFGSVDQGASVYRSFFIQNAGTGWLEGEVSADSTAFSITAGAGPYRLRTGQRWSVTVRFAPVSPGRQSAVIQTGSPGCGEVACTGVGGGPYCLVQPDTLDFGDVGVYVPVSLPVVLTNAGDVLLTGQAWLDCPGFSLVGSDRIYLYPDDSSGIVVQFAPVSEGPASCTLYVHTQDPHQVFCRGNGVGPRCWMSADGRGYGPVAVGTSVAWPFRIQNRGGGVLNGAISGACPDFPIVSGGGAFSLRQGEEWVVTVAFAPTSGGEKTCTIETGNDLCYYVSLSGTGLAGACVLEPDHIDFGSVQAGSIAEREFTIRNSGQGALSGSVTLACSDFSIMAGGGGFSLAGGGSRTVRIRFAPLTAGDKSCAVGTGDACATVPLTGSAYGQLCQVDPQSLSFGAVPFGQSADRDVLITNTGGGTFTGSVWIDCQGFSVVRGGGGFSLAPGARWLVTVRFAPVLEGNQACDLHIGSVVCPNIECQADGIGAICAFSPPAVDFGRVPLLGTVDSTVTVTNNGYAPILGTVTLTGDPAFSLASGGGPIWLDPGWSRDFLVRYRPESIGAMACTLNVGSCPRVPIVGESFDPPPVCFVSIDSLNFGIETVGQQDREAFFALRNTGGHSLVGNVSLLSSDFDLMTGDGPFSLGMGEALTVWVRFAPKSVGRRTAVVDLGTQECASVVCVGTGISYQVTAQLDRVDDVAKVWVNGRLSYTAKFGKSGTEQTGWTDIGHYPGNSGVIDLTYDLKLGENQIRITLENTGCCGASVTAWVWKAGEVVYSHAFTGNGHQDGILLDETVTVEVGVE